MTHDTPNDHPVVIFDGECNLCSWSVQFIIARDPAGRFRFASMQSPAGAALLAEHGFDSAALDGVVVVDQGAIFKGSDAALHITRYLSGAWPILSLLRFAPRWLREAVYQCVARNRYRWFGRRSACLVPTAALRRRFLD